MLRQERAPKVCDRPRKTTSYCATFGRLTLSPSCEAVGNKNGYKVNGGKFSTTVGFMAPWPWFRRRSGLWRLVMTADERWNDRLARRTGWRSDREAVLAIQQSRRWNDPAGIPPLGYVSAELQADREVVLAAVQQAGGALLYASKELQADREVVLAALQTSGCALECASAELRADRGVVLVAVMKHRDALLYAPAGMQADREVVLAAVNKSGDALRYASAEMKADRAIVLAAVTKSHKAFWQASAELQLDREVIKARDQQYYTRQIQSAWRLWHAHEVARDPLGARSTGISSALNPCHYDTA